MDTQQVERATKRKAEDDEDVVEEPVLVQEDDEDQGGEWQIAGKNARKKSKIKERLTQGQGSQAPPEAPKRLNKFKVIDDDPNEAYKTISTVQVRYKLNVSCTISLNSAWIITPKDEEAYDFLKETNLMNLKELKPEEKKKKAVVIRYHYDLPLNELEKHPQICKAERLNNKYKEATQTILCTFIGQIPEVVDLGMWGRYQVKTYHPEPLRCFKCQKFGHHKSVCNSGHICAVCSARHETEECIRKYKRGESTTPRCPNCKGNHPAWNRRCPIRLNKIQSALPMEHRNVPNRPSNRVQHRPQSIREPQRRIQRPLNRAPSTEDPQGPVQMSQNPNMRRRVDYRPLPQRTPRLRQRNQQREQTKDNRERNQPPRTKDPIPTIRVEHNSARQVYNDYTTWLLTCVGVSVTQEELRDLTNHLMQQVWQAAQNSISLDKSLNPPSHSNTNKPSSTTTPPSSASTSSNPHPTTSTCPSNPPQTTEDISLTLPVRGYPPLNPPPAAALSDSPPPSPPPSPKPLKPSAFRRIINGFMKK